MKIEKTKQTKILALLLPLSNQSKSNTIKNVIETLSHKMYDMYLISSDNKKSP